MMSRSAAQFGRRVVAAAGRGRAGVGAARSRICCAVAVRRARMTRSARRYGSSSVDAVRAGVGQRGHLGSDGDQPRRHRQFLFEFGEFGEVARQRGERGAAGGQPDHIGGHVGIAVAVPADPGAGPQDGLGEQFGVGPAGPQRLPHLGVDLAGSPRTTPPGNSAARRRSRRKSSAATTGSARSATASAPDGAARFRCCGRRPFRCAPRRAAASTR